MPLLTKRGMKFPEPSAISFTALDGTDSINYSGGNNEILLLQNTGVADITLVLKGDSATTVSRQGITSVDVSSGKSVTVPAGEYVSVSLKNAEAYLTDSNKTPAIQNGTSDIEAIHFHL